MMSIKYFRLNNLLVKGVYEKKHESQKPSRALTELVDSDIFNDVPEPLNGIVYLSLTNSLHT